MNTTLEKINTTGTMAISSSEEENTKKSEKVFSSQLDKISLKMFDYFIF